MNSDNESRIIPGVESRVAHALEAIRGHMLVHFRDVADLTGVHPKTIRRFMADGRIPFVQVTARKIAIQSHVLTASFLRSLIEYGDSVLAMRTAQVVYFVQAEGDGPIKIGIASDLARRFFELQQVHYAELKVRATTPGGMKAERAYHARFAEHHIRGEWFSPHPDILAEIDRLNRVAVFAIDVSEAAV